MLSRQELLDPVLVPEAEVELLVRTTTVPTTRLEGTASAAL
jgi:hypothetical protein